jgi:peptidoglycan/xylan/chitin deacetylase (PgdA/CDA1 family)
MRTRLAGTLRSAAGRLYWTSPHFLSHVRGKATILMYHRVVPNRELATTYVQPGMYVTPATFERHLRFLTSRFELLTLRELLAKWEIGGWDDSARYCVLTFDDGWIDNYRYAYPLLRAYGVPATIFLPTALIGSDSWLWSDRLGELLRRRRSGTPEDWDAQIERAKDLSDEQRNDLLGALEMEVGEGGAPRRRFVNWSEVDDMARHGIAFGSHSKTHANLTRLSGPALESELRESLEMLRARARTCVPVLAYPNGDHTGAVAAAAKAAGYRAAVTTMPGLERRIPSDPFRLRRIGVHDDVAQSIPLFALHVARQTHSALTKAAAL